MNRKEIEAFVQVLKNKNFFEAAFKLDYSPSAISKHISNLEKKLGVTLFIRSNRANSISLTKEGEALKHYFIQMNECFTKLQEDALQLKRNAGNMLIIGCNTMRAICNLEMIGGFRKSHPDIQLDIKDDYFDALEQLLHRKMIDGAFLRAQNGSQNYDILNRIINDTDLRAVSVSYEPDMYMVISSAEPLAIYDEAPLSAFSDFYIVFHPDKIVRENGGMLDPFLRICEKEGFELKTIYIAPNNMDKFELVTKTKIAVPSTKVLDYPGIKNIRLSDWDTFTASYFVSLKTNNSHALETFTKYMQQTISK